MTGQLPKKCDKVKDHLKTMRKFMWIFYSIIFDNATTLLGTLLALVCPMDIAAKRQRK